MKSGTQRDILVAWWLLFDEFEIGNGDAGVHDDDATGHAQGAGARGAGSTSTSAGGTAAAENAQKTKGRVNGSRARRGA